MQPHCKGIRTCATFVAATLSVTRTKHIIYMRNCLIQNDSSKPMVETRIQHPTRSDVHRAHCTKILKRQTHGLNDLQ
uniref:Uncharacterized protein n=1 Tax=Pararge aegeria TaxID=116150 RepID=S4NU61_9NEOP